MKNFEKGFNKSLLKFYSTVMKLTLKNPSSIPNISKIIKNQVEASKVRNLNKDRGFSVPPVIISSITGKCNLKCIGCYSNAKKLNTSNELSVEEYRDFLRQSQDLGVSINLLAGGEPFMRMDILKLAKEFPKIAFPVFTNGTLIDDKAIEFLKNTRNIIPILSLEGNKNITDARRGEGVYDKVREGLEKMKKAGIFFGVSVTSTSGNFRYITSDEFIKKIIDFGAKIVFFEEFVPLKKGSEYLSLDNNQREEFLQNVDDKRKEGKVLFVVLPGRDEKYGGCPASGKGFIHLSPEGFLEPCPFAPFSVHNIRETSLKEALSSEFFLYLRENHDKWQRKNGGCGLWSNREWVIKIRDYHLNKRNKKAI